MSFKSAFDTGIAQAFDSTFFGETIGYIRGGTTTSITAIVNFFPPAPDDDGDPPNSDPNDPFRWDFADSENVGMKDVGEVWIQKSSFPSTGQFAEPANSPLAGDEITHGSDTYIVKSAAHDYANYTLIIGQ